MRGGAQEVIDLPVNEGFAPTIVARVVCVEGD